MTCATSMESISQNSPELMERNYLGLSDCSSVDSSDVSSLSEANNNNLNHATELKLGLPGSQSQSSEKPLFPLLPSKDGICLSSQRNKRGFSDTMEGYSEGNWMFGASGTRFDASKSLGQRNFSCNTNENGIISSGAQPGIIKETVLDEPLGWSQSHATNGTSLTKANSSNPPAAKAQVVGWPPVRSFRKNILTTTSRNNDEVDGKPGLRALFVKVSMDGAPYLRKVELRSYSTYQQLSSALEKMFSCFTIGQYGSEGASGRERLSESKLRDLLHGSEYVVTYEDKDGDWMLVGDVPWDMFIGSCKRLKIMKGSDAIGIAPKLWESRRTETSFASSK